MSKRRQFLGGYATEKKDNKMADQPTPDSQFLSLIKARRYQEAIEMMPQVADINILDPNSGAAALHIAAGRRVTVLLRALWTRSDLNELRRDALGRYASEVAWHVGGDEELSARLMEREHTYAKKHGLTAWPKPALNPDPTPG